MVFWKKILAAFLAIICLCGPFYLSASAATVNSAYNMICYNTGYRNNKTQMYGQSSTEKYIKLDKNKTLKINPYTAVNTNNGNKLKKYVCFTVWVYDINTGKRLVNKVCSNDGTISWKNTTGKTVHLSVQVRPYISQSAWKISTYSNINAYIMSTQYRFTCKY